MMEERKRIWEVEGNPYIINPMTSNASGPMNEEAINLFVTSH